MADTHSPIEAFVALEGGGAKGLVHVGALKAMEERSIVIKGVAGTSAGALVAGLIAAGYTADELLNEDSGASIIHALSFKSATELLGNEGWRAIVRARRAASLVSCPQVWLSFTLLLLTVNVLLFCLVHDTIFTGFLATLELVALGAAALASLMRLRRGLASLEKFIDNYDRALRRKVGGDETRRVTFEELSRFNRPLKVVASNIASRSMVVYGTGITPGVAVAEAVAASACIPGIFAPVYVKASQQPDAPHYDGGLVSNLPAWAFDDERALEPNVLTLALEIAPDGADPGGHVSLFGWFGCLIRTAVLGGSTLNTRGMDRMHSFRLSTDLGLLDFDVGGNQARQTVRDSRIAAGALIDHELFDVPRLFNSACAEVRDRVKGAIQAMMKDDGGDSSAVSVRAMLAVPSAPGGHALRILYGEDVLGLSEDRLLLPLDGTLVGAVYKQREAIFDAEPFTKEFDLPGTSNAARRALVWPDVKWRASIPIFTSRAPVGGPPAMVLAIDGNGDKEYALRVIDDAFVDVAAEGIARAADAVDQQREILENRK